MIYNYVESYLKSLTWKGEEDDKKEMEDIALRYMEYSRDYPADIQRMIENYNFTNGNIKREDYLFLCSVLGTDEGVLELIDNYNYIQQAINALTSEEFRRPFPFSVYTNSPRIRNRIEREKSEIQNSYGMTIFNTEIERMKRKMEIDLKDIPDEEKEAEKARLDQLYDNRYDRIGELSDIINKYETTANIEEILANKLLKYAYNKFDFKMIRNRCFRHMAISGYQAAEIYTTNRYQPPIVEDINPINLYYHKSPDITYIGDGMYAGRFKLLTFSDALYKYGNYIDEDKMRLIFSGTQGTAFGQDDFVFDGDKNNIFKRRRVNDPSRKYSGRGSVIYGEVNDPVYGVPGDGFVGINALRGMAGANGSTYTLQNSYLIEENVLYWKYPIRLGKVTYINDYGEVDFTFVSSDFIIPDEAIKEKVKPDYTGVDKIEWSWTDYRDNPIKIEWIVVDTVYVAAKLGEHLVMCEPVTDAYRSLKNPYKVKLNIDGVAMNNLNSFPSSFVDMMKPWNIFIIAMFGRLKKLIKLDRGKVIGLNINMVTGAKMTPEQMMSSADKLGTIFYNPIGNIQDDSTAYLAQGKPMESIDVSNFQTMQQYIQIIEFLESNLLKSAGLNPQRMANSSPSATASDNHRDMQTSQTITEPIFVLHDSLWVRIMTQYMEQLFTYITEYTSVFETILNDEEKVLIETGLININDNYNLMVSDIGRNKEILDIVQQQVLSLIQNGMVTMPQFINMLYSDDVIEIKRQAQDYEDLQREREEQAQKGQQDHEIRLEEEKRKTQEDAQIHDMMITKIDSYVKMYIEKFKAQSLAYSMDGNKDYNKDGIPDYMQMEQLNRKLDIEERKNELKEYEIEANRKSKEVEQDIKERLSESKVSTSEAQLDLKRQELESKRKSEENKLDLDYYKNTLTTNNNN